MMSPSRTRSVLFSAVLVLPLLSVLSGSALTVSAGAATASNTCGPAAHFSAHHFPRRPKIDNKWLPLKPGANTVLRGTVRGDDGELHQHSIVATVTDLTKKINGVRTLVVFERDFDDGQLQESELAFEAQDRAGRVWNVGEYPEEYEDGALAGAPSTWMAGIAHATAGLGMLAHPRLHARAYLQGLAPEVDFFDCAKVAKTHQHVCVRVGCFNNVLVVDEWAPLEPEDHQVHPVGQAKLGQQMTNVRLDAASGNVQRLSDLHVGQAQCNQLEYVQFTAREATQQLRTRRARQRQAA